MVQVAWRGAGLALVALAALLILEPPFQNAEFVGFVTLLVLAVLELFVGPSTRV